MFSIIHSATIIGVQSVPIQVEVDAANGLPQETIVGLADTVVRESKNRIRTAIKHSGFEYPLRHYTINLAPANIKKQGPTLDLAIAAGILQATGQLPEDPNALFIGELSLNGKLQKMDGLISILSNKALCQNKTIFIPKANHYDMMLMKNPKIIPLNTLHDLKHYYQGKLAHYQQESLAISKQRPNLDYNEVHGQDNAKRALEIAVTGRHNILLIGPPGSGKSMLLKRITTITPELSLEKSIEAYNIHTLGLKGKHIEPSLIPQCRTPHHSISYAGMVGGGSQPKPGEISLAHHGILFLDELPEFQRNVIEVLRQPLEDNEISVSRANISVQYPADFMLIATMNPCPCGYHNDPIKTCSCSPAQIDRYQKKISGPILDRIDLCVHVPRLNETELLSPPSPQTSDSSTAIRTRIENARQIQYKRYQTEQENSTLTAKQIDQYCQIQESDKPILQKAIQSGKLSGRSLNRTLKVSRSIADLAGEKQIKAPHLLEALSYRL